MTLSDIAAALRKMFPEATCVALFVNAHEHIIETTYRDKSGPEHGASYRCLDGKWAHERATVSNAN